MTEMEMEEKEQTDRPNPPAPPGKITIRLRDPIIVDGEETEFLFLPKKVTLKNLKITDRANGDIEKAIFLIADLAGIPVLCAEQINALDIQENSELGEYISNFLLVSPQTGES